MPDLPTMLVFVAASIALIAIPGPNLIYIATRSLSQGRRAGLASALGVEAATLLHVVAATVGLSALIASSPTAFTAVKYLGAGYLLYLGARTLLCRGAPAAATDDAAGPLARAFAEGMIVNLLNPKVALFFLAFLPQFVDPARGAATQTLVLGAAFFVIALVMDLLYVAAAGAVAGRLAGRAGSARWATGAVYLALGAFAALAGGHAIDSGDRA